jgi:hypothetical protein
MQFATTRVRMRLDPLTGADAYAQGYALRHGAETLAYCLLEEDGMYTFLPARSDTALEETLGLWMQAYAFGYVILEAEKEGWDVEVHVRDDATLIVTCREHQVL